MGTKLSIADCAVFEILSYAEDHFGIGCLDEWKQLQVNVYRLRNIRGYFHVRSILIVYIYMEIPETPMSEMHHRKDEFT